MKTTVQKYKAAYAYGHNDKKNAGEYTNNSMWQLKAFELAYTFGFEGVEIDWNDVVECERAGNIPESGVSYNHLAGVYEKGLSVLNIIGKEEVNSALWFYDRKKVNVSGIRLPFTGSDGEILILPLGVDEVDF